MDFDHSIAGLPHCLFVQSDPVLAPLANGGNPAGRQRMKLPAPSRFRPLPLTVRHRLGFLPHGCPVFLGETRLAHSGPQQLDMTLLSVIRRYIELTLYPKVT